MKRSAAFYVALPLFALAAVASDGAWATDAKIAAGATIYGNYCSNCHGDELRNTSGGATFDLTRLRAADHDRFVNSVLNGKTQMRRGAACSIWSRSNRSGRLFARR